jgi:hypothetical protein
VVPSAPFAGTRRFELRSCLGGGGMGVVYRALDRERGVEVALKTIRAPRPEAIHRFKAEFHAVQDLAHPNLVSLGELFVEDGVWFFTMELIDGVDFIDWVRPRRGAPEPRGEGWLASTTPLAADSPVRVIPVLPAAAEPLDEARLRDALAQLAAGLMALHDAGKVHRDVKPSNVLVTPDGRVVLLDFGLATDLASAPHQTEREVFGTTAYMAPEQAAAQPVGPESDWYAVGSVLYQALTGRLPFEGPPLEVLAAKQAREPAPPSALEPACPPDLDRLCVALMAHTRARRPLGREVLAALAERRAPQPRTSAQTQVAPFVGRDAELTALGAALEDARAGHARFVVVRGESGVGKSALVRRFVEALPAGTLALGGRCYERESVPYKAFDGLVDALGQHMRRLGQAGAAALLPRRAHLLPQVFPVLGRVEAFAAAPTPRHEVLAPQELRSRVFAAVRELVTRLAERQPLVLVIDDLHWGDADSFALLGELLRPPDAPPLLLIATARPGVLVPGADELPLGRLPPEAARALAELLVDRAGAGVTADQVAEEAGGHPLFIDELVRHHARHGAAPALRLEEALGARVAGLEPELRLLLELLALAGQPLDADTAAEAAGVGGGEIDRKLAALRVANLVRSAAAPRSVETYHDRVREAVVAGLDDEARVALHRRLAAALEGRADAETLSVHKRGAGDRVGAARHAAQAAEEAAAAFAFDRAARLYRVVLELRSEEAAPSEVTAAHRRALYGRLGDVLAAAGRGPEAAAAYQAAAAGAAVADALDLRRRAAEQLLISGHIDEGLAALAEVLGAVGLRMPATPGRALVSLVARRARLRLRGLGHTPRDATQIAAETLTRIDICWSGAAGLAIVDTIRGADFQSRHLLLALQAGEPYRVARAVALEAGFIATAGPSVRARVDALLAEASALAARAAAPHALGLAQMSAAIAAFCQGRWRDAHTLGDEAQATLGECAGVIWELDNARLASMWALLNRGELPEVFRRGEHLLRDARERGDHYMATNLRSRLLQLVHLAADDVEGARAEAAHSLADWTHHGFHFQHYNSLAVATQIELYAGAGARARALVEEKWPALARSQLLRVIQVRVEMTHLRGAAALLAGDAAAAARAARALGREPVAWGRALGKLLDAARARTPAGWTAAAAALEVCDLPLHAAAARRRQAELTGDEEGQTEADAVFTARGIAQPARWAGMLAVC